MERSRHRKSQSASGIEGAHRIQKNRLSSDSYSTIDGSTRHNMYKLEQGSSSRQSTQSPEAKFLAEQMYRDMESKRRSSNIISRLTGLEGLSSLWHVHRRQKRLLKGYHQHKKVSVSIQTNRQIHEQQQEFNDVYEDFEASPHFVDRRCSSRWSASSMLTKSEMPLIQDKFTDAKCLSADETDQDFLFVNHLRVAHRRRSEIHEQRKDGLLLEPRNCHIPYVSSKKISKIQSEEKNEEDVLPREIFVLRPSRRRNSVGFSKPISQEAKEIAREITRRRRGHRDGTRDANFSLRGYGGNESDFESEFEKIKLSSRNSFSDDNKWSRHPYSGSVNREAKKRLSERWKITNKYRDLEIVSEGGRLGEMLERERPLRISSRPSSRSSSLPPSIGGRSQNKVAKGKNLSHKESQDSKSRSKKPLPFQHVYINHMDSSSSLKANFEIQMEANVKDSPKQRFLFQMPAKDDSKGSTVSDAIVAVRGSTSTQFPQKQYSFGDNDPEDFYLQDLPKQPPEEGLPSLQDLLGAELASSESSKVLDHASPISVFEVPFIEDMSSCSESFERVNAELNELQMQLQLLKMESGAYADIIPTEDDITRLSSGKGWEVNYALDVLIHSRLQEFGFDIFSIMWHSPNCPLNPELFENLEKKYSDDRMGLTGIERKLLFDRINSAVLDIFQQHVDLYPWVMPKLGGTLHSTLQKERVKDALEKLINNESGIGKIPERADDKEMQWMSFKGEIDLIGIEIEKLLIEDIVAEFLYF